MKTCLTLLGEVRLGTDGPAGSGVQPLGIMRMVAMLLAFGNVPAAEAFCFGNGNTSGRSRNTPPADRLPDHVL